MPDYAAICVFPMVGNSSEKVSNGWKKWGKGFQWLEKRGKKFPMVGKTVKKHEANLKGAEVCPRQLKNPRMPMPG
ncbi:MAG: hypothetical protein PHG65_07960 [Kiritimatiellae bacterium]|nr:hypothetical protein [Kiritimatiellia bacterium]